MILIIDDDKAVTTSISLLLKQQGLESTVSNSPEHAFDILMHETVSLVILDMNFTVDTTGRDGINTLKKIKEIHQQIPVILITGWGHMSLAIEGMKAGAADFINKPWDNELLLKSVYDTLHLQKQETDGFPESREKLDTSYDFSKITGQDPQLIKVLHIAGRISNTNASVLITGESGTGKELIAEAIHMNSDRNNKPFVKVNLGGIPPTLFESEMFGHTKGAFTDAYTSRSGRFLQANTGSLFLDEIGELDLTSQVKLLRVLQERKFEVLGSNETQSVDIRIISATNKNLVDMVASGQFREDLLYRINLITLHMPPLRERSTDIPLLVEHFVSGLKRIYNKPETRVNPEVMEWLKTLPMRGNIRELKNLVERTILVSEKDELDIPEFRSQIENIPHQLKTKNLPSVGDLSLEEMEIEMIKKTMAFHSNRISEVAKSLGISRNSLYRRLEKYNIKYEN